MKSKMGPKGGIQQQKDTRLRVFTKLKERNERDFNLWWKTWVHHFRPESKNIIAIMEWKHTNLPTWKVFQSQALATKVMLTVFLDA